MLISCNIGTIQLRIENRYCYVLIILFRPASFRLYLKWSRKVSYIIITDSPVLKHSNQKHTEYTGPKPGSHLKEKKKFLARRSYHCHLPNFTRTTSVILIFVRGISVAYCIIYLCIHYLNNTMIDLRISHEDNRVNKYCFAEIWGDVKRVTLLSKWLVKVNGMSTCQGLFYT